MDPFSRLEALIEAGCADAVEQARSLLNSLIGESRGAAAAADEFLIEMMTLVFLVETGREAFQNSARRLARLRLGRVKILIAG